MPARAGKGRHETPTRSSFSPIPLPSLSFPFLPPPPSFALLLCTAMVLQCWRALSAAPPHLVRAAGTSEEEATSDATAVEALAAAVLGRIAGALPRDEVASLSGALAGPPCACLPHAMPLHTLPRQWHIRRELHSLLHQFALDARAK